MATIKSPEDWYALAASVVPKLPGYLREFNLDLPYTSQEMMMLVAEKDHKKLYGVFDLAWNLLPDNPSIRHHPFFDLCDLCSEYWVFDPREQTDELRQD